MDEVLAARASDYYAVLRVTKGADEVEIKKSYRKLAIKLHPDKNKHPKASDAFKVIAKAFEVLGDTSKRKLYDMTGRDPDARGGGSAGGGGGMPHEHAFRGGRNPFGGQFGGQFGQQVDAEDLFNMFFGGGMPQGGFQSFQFGNGPGNGFFFQQGGMPGGRFGQGVPRRSAHPGANARNRATGQQEPPTPNWVQYMSQYLPIVIILLSAIFSLFFGDEDTSKIPKRFHGKVPKYSFEEKRPYVMKRSTPLHKLDYFVTQKTSEDFDQRRDSVKEWRGLDSYVEGKFVEQMQNGCQIERQRQQAMLNDAYGLFFNDNELIERAKKMKMPHCERLSGLDLL